MIPQPHENDLDAAISQWRRDGGHLVDVLGEHGFEVWEVGTGACEWCGRGSFGPPGTSAMTDRPRWTEESYARAVEVVAEYLATPDRWKHLDEDSRANERRRARPLVGRVLDVVFSVGEPESLAVAVERFLDVWDEFDGPPLTVQDTYDAVSESVEGLRAVSQASVSTELGGGLGDERLLRLLSVLDAGLDLSDDYTMERAAPGELVSCTRPSEVWRDIRAAVAAVRAAGENPE